MNNLQHLQASTAMPPGGINPTAPLNPDWIITEHELSRWTRLSQRSLQRARLDGNGVPFVRLGGRRIGYRVGDVLAWIKERTFASTSAATVQGGAP